jgi:hypothetical protein
MHAPRAISDTVDKLGSDTAINDERLLKCADAAHKTTEMRSQHTVVVRTTAVIGQLHVHGLVRALSVHIVYQHTSAQ